MLCMNVPENRMRHSDIHSLYLHVKFWNHYKSDGHLFSGNRNDFSELHLRY